MDFEDYSLDIQSYILQTLNDAVLAVYRDEIYVNTYGQEFVILEDSFDGTPQVWVRQNIIIDDNIVGQAKRLVDKTILFC